MSAKAKSSLMKSSVFENLIKNDISRKVFIIFALLISVLKLILSAQQMIYITPGAAPIDDELMFNAAMSIANGTWLGEYNWLTLSKYPLFAIWLAFLNTIGVPYLLGGQILYLFSCVCAVYSLAPFLQKNYAKLLLFFVLVFNPVQTAAAVQLRVYRENITSALSLLLFAGFAGMALRANLPVKKMFVSIIIASIGLSGSYLNREDGAWFLIFCIPATAITCYFILVKSEKLQKKIKAILCQLIPYTFLIICVIALSFVNLQHYGRFTISDFTSAEFNDACGALMRVSMAEEFEQIDKVPVSKQALDAVKSAVPQFEEVVLQLESEFLINNFGDLQTGEYTAGGFYWALRSAVYSAGFATSASEAQQYYETLASSINALVDSGELHGAEGEISSSLMPFKVEYLQGVFAEASINVGRMLILEETSPYFAHLSETTAQDEQLYEDFLKTQSNTAAQEGSHLPYHSIIQRIAYFTFDVLRYAFAVLMCVSFVVAVYWQMKNSRHAVQNTFKKQYTIADVMWWVQLGFLLSVVLRCLIVAYMFVTSFNTWVGRMPYLCAAQAALILFCFGGAVLAVKDWRHKRA